MQTNESLTKAYFTEKEKYFASGATLSYAFRIKQLQILKQAVKKREDTIIEALKADFGKPEMEGYMTEIGFLYEEINFSIKHLKRWMKPGKVSGGIASFPTKYEVRAVPKGIALIIGPWNYPFQLLFSPLVGSIAAGNCTVLKPSHVTTHVSAIAVELIESSFEKAYISAVPGPGSELVPLLMNTYRFDHVFFTGSPDVGKSVAVAAAGTHTSVTLELGGKSPVIVDESADLVSAAHKIAWGKCINGGQTCIAPDYALVHTNIKTAFISELKKAITEFYGENPELSSDFARIISDRRFATVSGYLIGAKILSGGRTNPATRYIEPTLIDEPSLDSDVMRSEIFGPILPIISFTNLQDVQTIVGRNPFPLALYIFSKNKHFYENIFSSIRFGGGCLNNTIIHLADPRVSFGGIASSGLGNYHGKKSFDTFSHEKTLAFSGKNSMNTLIFPPYTKQKKALVEFFY